jgi:hypothetical protein
MNEPRTSKYPEHFRRPEVTSVPFELPEPTGDHLLGDQFARQEIAEVIDDLPALTSMREAHRSYREGYQRLREAMKARDPSETEALHLTESRKVADRWLKAAAKKSDEARARAESALTSVRIDIRDKCGFDETPRAAEVRSLLRGMKPEERTQIVSEAIKSGDAEIMGAILNGSPVLTGFTEEDRQSFKTAYVRTHAPDLLKQEKALELAIEINSRTNLEALDNYGRIFDHGRMAAIAQGHSKAQQARAAVLED